MRQPGVTVFVTTFVMIFMGLVIESTQAQGQDNTTQTERVVPEFILLLYDGGNLDNEVLRSLPAAKSIAQTCNEAKMKWYLAETHSQTMKDDFNEFIGKPRDPSLTPAWLVERYVYPLKKYGSVIIMAFGRKGQELVRHRRIAIARNGGSGIQRFLTEVRTASPSDWLDIAQEPKHYYQEHFDDLETNWTCMEENGLPNYRIESRSIPSSLPPVAAPQHNDNPMRGAIEKRGFEAPANAEAVNPEQPPPERVVIGPAKQEFSILQQILGVIAVIIIIVLACALIGTVMRGL